MTGNKDVMEFGNDKPELVADHKNFADKRKIEKEHEKIVGEQRPENRGLSGAGTTTSTELSARRNAWKKGLTIDSSQPASVGYDKKSKERATVDHVMEGKDKARRMSFLSVFKFHRRKSVRESSQDSDSSDCGGNDALIPLAGDSAELNEALDVFVSSADAEKVARQPVVTNTGNLGIIEAGKDDGLRKVGRWQQVRTRLQQKMTLPNKMDMNFRQEDAPDRKPVKGKQGTSTESVKVDATSGKYSSFTLQGSSSTNSNSVAQCEQSSDQEQAVVSSSFKAFQKPSPKVLLHQKSLYSDYGSPCQEEVGAVQPHVQPHVQSAERGSDLATNFTSTGHNIKKQDNLKVAKLGPFSSKRESVSKGSDACPSIPLKPQASKERLGLRKSVGSLGDPKVSKDRNIIQAFIRRHRISLSSTSKTGLDDETGIDFTSATKVQPLAIKSSPQTLVSSDDTFASFLEVAIPESVSPSRSVLDPGYILPFDNSHLLLNQKRAASLPDLINCSDNRSDKSNSTMSERADVFPDATKVKDSAVGFGGKKYLTKVEKLQKRIRLSSVSDSRDSGGDLGRPPLKVRDYCLRENLVFRNEGEDVSAEGRRVAPPCERNGVRGKRERATSGDRTSTIMFGRKSHGDVKKSAQKILDPKKDHVTRLKHLRIVLESYDVGEAKSFFEQYYSVVYFLFHEGFTNVETSLGQRANKAHREELDCMLFILEKILTLLPEMIHKRWQLHSIGRIMRKLLHSANSLKLRREGMRLFLMWYEILMDNATEECHKMFRSLVPKLAPSASSDNLEADFFLAKTFSNTKVTVPDIYPILLSQTGEKQPDNLSKWLLEGLLIFMVSEVSKIRWNNRELHEYCFKFLFDKFKDHYLPEIFPELNQNNSIYEPCLDLPEKTTDCGGCTQTLGLCQETVVKWMTTYTVTPTAQNLNVNQTSTEKCEVDLIENGRSAQEAEQLIPGSNTSTLSTASSYTENCSNESSAGSDDHSFSEQEIVKNVLYSSRENINIVHEVFRQAFLFPFHHSAMARRVINVYRSWFQSDTRPIFMQDKRSFGGAKDADRRQSTSSMASGQISLQMEHASAALALESTPKVDVTVGLQKVLQVFITNSANLFMIESLPVKDAAEQQVKLEDQVDVCKRVLSIYRHIVTNVFMDKVTWEQLLLVLLKITSTIMTVIPPVFREKSLNGQLAEPLFKTLILAWIKANLSILVSEPLWKQFLETLSSLTNWIQLIREWSKTMEMLTRVLARYIYAIDLRDLPLDKLSEQKGKRLRGKIAGTVKAADRSLSRSWMKQTAGDGSGKQQHQQPQLSQQQQQQQLQNRPSKALAGVIAPSLASFTNGIIVGSGSSRRVNVSATRMDSVCQRSRSGESSPMCQSQLDLSFSSFPANADSLGVSGLPRSNSDSSILIDQSKAKALGLNVVDVQSEANPRVGYSFQADDEDVSSQSHNQSETTDRVQEECLGRCRPLSVNDNISVASNDSSQLQYQMMVNRSGDSSSFCIEQGSYSDRSDTEVLLHVSDSGSTSSHSVQRSKNSSFSQGNDLSATSQVEEEDEEEDDDVEEEEEEENPDQPDGGISIVGTVEESLDDEDTEDEGTVHSFEERQTKDTHNRDSMRIDDSETLTDLSIDAAKANGKRSLLAGGNMTGWTPDVAVVLWRRMLGSLGNINDIKNSEMHAQVYEYLCDLLDTFIKIRENQGVSKDNHTTPAEPTFVPYVLVLAPWLFEALNLSDNYKLGKLLAYQLLCTATLRQHDIEISADHLNRFYMMLHIGLAHSSQDITNVLVRYCNAKFFSLPLSGSTLMMLDLIHGSKSVLSQPNDAKNVPRAEAMSLLGSLLCFPNHMGEILVLEPSSKELTVFKCTDIKDHIVNILLKFTRKEPPGLSRCIALSNLGIYLYEELCHPETLHPKLNEAFDLLLSALKSNEKAACQVAAHVLTLLCDHLPLMLLKLPVIPHKVVKDMTITITLLLQAVENGSSEESQRTASQVLVSVMFTLLEWCMRLPYSLLLMPAALENKSLLHQVLDVLNMVINGSSKAVPTSQGNVPSTDLSDDKNLPQTSQSVPSTPMAAVDISTDSRVGVQKIQRPDNGVVASVRQKTNDSNSDAYGVKLAARTIMLHLINYLYHFPMNASNTSQMNSEVQEFHDSTLEEVGQNDLPAQILASANTQFFVINNMTLMSFMELPEQPMHGVLDGVTAGLATEKTVCRAIVRDPSGKHCWDSSILYGSKQCRSGSYPNDPPVLLRIDEDEDVDEKDVNQLPPVSSTTTSIRENKSSLAIQEVPTSANILPEADALDVTLRYLGSTSPECLLHSGEALNAAFHTPVQLSSNVEQQMREMLMQQQLEEARHVRMHNCDRSMTSKPMQPLDNCDPLSPFHLCRLFFSQLGYMVCEKRKQFDLLQKSEKLLRELKHLDSQRCRETHKIAVIYVGPGQEDKVSILRNAAGSRLFEEFVAALGWQVDLQSHSGFMGGLQRNQMTGSTAPYYATSTKEVIFHVSTQMPSDTEEDQLRKLKHLGNDEVHIVWSEHKRDYRHSIIPTDFGDVLIIIYPLENGLFRIQIKRRPEVPYFGPLFDGAIVDFQVLPGLVRATAINAGQMLCTQKPHYQTFYEERMHCINNIVQKYKMLTMFEVFSSQIFAPGQQLGDENLAPPVSLNNGQPQQLTKVAKAAAEKNYLSWPTPLGSLRKKMTTDV